MAKKSPAAGGPATAAAGRGEAAWPRSPVLSIDTARTPPLPSRATLLLNGARARASPPMLSLPPLRGDRTSPRLPPRSSSPGPPATSSRNAALDIELVRSGQVEYKGIEASFEELSRAHALTAFSAAEFLGWSAVPNPVHPEAEALVTCRFRVAAAAPGVFPCRRRCPRDRAGAATRGPARRHLAPQHPRRHRDRRPRRGCARRRRHLPRHRRRLPRPPRPRRQRRTPSCAAAPDRGTPSSTP